jgi:lipopolysaccharide export system protein LptC
VARSNFYSKAVVWVKITLPLIGIALLSSIFLLSGAPDPDAALPYAEVDVDQITREQRVSQPRFAGVLADGQEIVLVAEAVSADGGQTDRIRAQDIEGRVDLDAADFLTIEAQLADIDMASQRATLSDGVTLQTSLGYQVTSEQMLVALDVFNLRAPTPIHITGPGLDLVADTMQVSGPTGQTIVRFNGAVRVLYDPQI